MSSDFAIYWFRQDLRLADNPALSKALAHDRVLVVYILDDINSGPYAMGSASRLWLRHSLRDLSQTLDNKLLLLCGDARRVLEELVSATNAQAVYWNRCYEPWRIKRDTQIKQQLQRNNVDVETFNGSLLWEPWNITKKDGSPYKVFTPYFKRGCLSADASRAPRMPLATPEPHLLFDKIELESYEGVKALSLDTLLPKSAGAWEADVINEWSVGEQAASEKLDQFIQTSLSQYKHGRNIPALNATSRLSPHMHFGEISPHRVWYEINRMFDRSDDENVYHFCSELGWREFSYYLLYHWPTLPDTEFNSLYRDMPWQTNADKLAAWQRGETGVPIVDAGMRELWQTGSMHNRVRMIAASYLVKNLLIDWRHGAAWFWDCLFDADLAANSQSWQWVAGTGADAAPYFRIFNPVLQGEKFDPDGDYIKHFCPELSSMSVKKIHQPWAEKPPLLEVAGVELGVNYPKPLVDLKETRAHALRVYKSMREPDNR